MSREYTNFRIDTKKIGGTTINAVKDGVIEITVPITQFEPQLEEFRKSLSHLPEWLQEGIVTQAYIAARDGANFDTFSQLFAH